MFQKYNISAIPKMTKGWFWVADILRKTKRNSSKNKTFQADCYSGGGGIYSSSVTDLISQTASGWLEVFSSELSYSFFYYCISAT